jgi:hypothetical protein
LVMIGRAEDQPKPISEIRDFFGRLPKFMKSSARTNSIAEARIGLDMARNEFITQQTKENALDYYRAAGWAWARCVIETEELEKIGDCTRPYFDGERP